MNIWGARVFLVVISYIFAYYFAVYFGALYSYFFPSVGTGLIPNSAANVLIGIPTALVFSVFFFLTAFGGKYKYWWIGIFLIPSAWFYLQFDLLHIYFPVILGLTAWGLGIVVNKTLHKLAPAFMARIS